jgi:hypothetical protein
MEANDLIPNSIKIDAIRYTLSGGCQAVGPLSSVNTLANPSPLATEAAIFPYSAPKSVLTLAGFNVERLVSVETKVMSRKTRRVTVKSFFMVDLIFIAVVEVRFDNRYKAYIYYIKANIVLIVIYNCV